MELEPKVDCEDGEFPMKPVPNPRKMGGMYQHRYNYCHNYNQQKHNENYHLLYCCNHPMKQANDLPLEKAPFVVWEVACED